MTLTTTCPKCHRPVMATLPEGTPEGEAEFISSRLWCLPCAASALHKAFGHGTLPAVSAEHVASDPVTTTKRNHEELEVNKPTDRPSTITPALSSTDALCRAKLSSEELTKNLITVTIINESSLKQVEGSILNPLLDAINTAKNNVTNP